MHRAHMGICWLFIYGCFIAPFDTAVVAAPVHTATAAPQTHQTCTDQALSSRPLALPFAHVRAAKIYTARVFDIPAKTLIISFHKEQQILSSLHGWREGVMQVGNHYSAPPAWPVTHRLGFAAADQRIAALYGRGKQRPLLLHTGADMDNLAYAQAASDGFVVGVLATAGVSGNAMRASEDSGDYVEPGTVNIIVLTNRRLTPEAMSRGLITVTEAKTAVLQALDVRSSYSGTAATGTGTDNVLMVGGEGPAASMTGGHTKLGELLALATAQAVREAIYKQNGLRADRDIVQRLREHRIALLPDELPVGFQGTPQDAALRMKKILRDPRFAGFMEAALALGDSTRYGLIHDLRAYELWCLSIARQVSGQQLSALPSAYTDQTLTLPARMALNALAAGIPHFNIEMR